MNAEAAAMIEHAEAFLESARMNLQHGGRHRAVAYSEARHTVELAGKVLLLLHTGSYPRRGRHGHRIGSLLAQHGLVPAAVSLGDLNRILDHHTRGAYGFFEDFTTEEVEGVLEVAAHLLESVSAAPE